MANPAHGPDPYVEKVKGFWTQQKEIGKSINAKYGSNPVCMFCGKPASPLSRLGHPVCLECSESSE